MKTLLFVFLVVCAPAVGLGQEEPATNGTNRIMIAARAARDHIDVEASVTGKIAEVNKAQRLVRLNFDHAFPKQTFTAVIFAEKTNLFPEIDKLIGKTVEVSGRITDYHGRPEIILTSTNQLKVVEQPADNEK